MSQDQRLYKFQLQDDPKYGGIFTPEQIQNLSAKIMKYYDGNGDGVIENMEVRNMMSDGYRAIGKGFKPTATDLVQFTRIITRTTDAHKINRGDIQNLCTRFFLAKEFQQQPSQSYIQHEQKKHAHHKNVHPQIMNPQVQQRLDVAKRLFKKIDSDNSGFITEDEVPKLLRETYQQMGINNYNVSEDDVRSWMQMTDTDGDGKVTLQEYESLVIRSLERAGIKLY